MATQEFSQSVKLFPLTRFIRKYGITVDEIGKNLSESVILSQIGDLSRDIIERLEMAGIYDTHDFEKADPQIQAYLGLSNREYLNVKSIIEQHVQKRSNLPKFVLDLPDNYCLLAVGSDSCNNALSIIWNQMMFTIQNSVSEGWNHVKYLFEKLFKKMSKPELIGEYSDAQLPVWLEQISDYSVYVGGIQTNVPLSAQVKRWGFPLLKNSKRAENIAMLRVIHLNYLFQLASRNSLTQTDDLEFDGIF